MKTAKILLVLVATILSLVVGALVYLLVFLDLNSYKPKIEEEARKAGFAVSLGGDITLSLYPDIAVELASVSLKESLAAGAAEFTAFERVAVSVQLMPLLAGKFQINGVSLEGAQISLRKDKSGRGNWERLGTAENLAQPPQKPTQAQQKPGATAKTEETPSPKIDPKTPRFPEIAIAELRVRDLEITYTDEASAATYAIENLNMSIDDLRLNEQFPLQLSTNFTVDSPQQKAAGSLDLAANLALDLERQNFQVQLKPLEIDLKSLELPAQKLTITNLPVQLSVEANYAGTAQRLSIKNLNVKVAELQLKGDLSAENLLEKPAATFALALDVSSLGRFADRFGQENIPHVPLALQTAGSLDLQKNTAKITRLTASTDHGELQAKVNLNALQPKPIGSYSATVKVVMPNLSFSGLQKLTAKAEGNFDLKKDRQESSLTLAARGLDLAAHVGIGNLSTSLDTTLGLKASIANVEKLLQLPSAVAVPAIRRLEVDLKAQAKLKQGSAQIKNLSITSPDIGKISAKGRLGSLLDKPSADLQLSIAVEELRKKLTHLNLFALPVMAEPGKTLQNFSLATRIQYAPDSLKLNNFRLKLDSFALQGDLRANLKSYATRFSLAGGRINADHYLPPAAPKKKEEKQDKPQKKREPITYSQNPLLTAAHHTLLKQLDVDGKITLDQLTIKKIPLGAITLALKAKDGVLSMPHADARVFGGSLKNSLHADLRQLQSPQFRLTHSSTGIDLAQAQDIFIEKAYASGAANLSATLGSSGNSVYDLVHQAEGDIQFNVQNGRLLEYNINSYVCKAVAFTNSAQITPALYPNYTAFSTLAGKAKILQGVLNNEYVQLSGGGLQLKGRGTVDAPKTSFDYTLAALISGSPQDSACRVHKELARFEWPVRCRGVFHGDPVDFCRPDFEAITKQTGAILEKAAQAALAQAKKAAEKALKEAEAKAKEEAERAAKQLEDEVKKKAEDLLKGLF